MAPMSTWFCPTERRGCGRSRSGKSARGQALIDAGLTANETVVWWTANTGSRKAARVRELHGKAAKDADLQSSVQEALP